MNAKKNEKKGTKTTPPWLKTILTSLLILSAIAGYAHVFLLSSPGSAPAMLPVIKLSPNDIGPLKEMNIQKFSSLLTQTVQNAEPEISISFKGILRGETGIVAIINDEMVVQGAEIAKGIEVIDITPRALTLKYKDQTQRMNIGETVTIRR